jgi:hypothetical protein
MRIAGIGIIRARQDGSRSNLKVLRLDLGFVCGFLLQEESPQGPPLGLAGDDAIGHVALSAIVEAEVVWTPANVPPMTLLSHCQLIGLRVSHGTRRVTCRVACAWRAGGGGAESVRVVRRETMMVDTLDGGVDVYL